jgi:hypothetical protein
LPNLPIQNDKRMPIKVAHRSSCYFKLLQVKEKALNAPKETIHTRKSHRFINCPRIFCISMKPFFASHRYQTPKKQIVLKLVHFTNLNVWK